MKASVYFRIAAILIVLFAAGHTLGFRQVDPGWGLDPTIASLKKIRFTTQGFNRSYWDFFVGFGLLVTTFLLLAAFAAWQLASLPESTLVSVRWLAWALTLAFCAVAFLSWRYFFMTPIIFSLLILVCLLAGTLSIRRHA